MVDEYDLYLAAILAVLLGGLAISAHPVMSLHHGLVSASLIASIIILDMLFRNPPTEPTRARPAAIIVGIGWVITVVAYL